jgi:hypothetical protein
MWKSQTPNRTATGWVAALRREAFADLGITERQCPLYPQLRKMLTAVRMALFCGLDHRQ